MKTYSVDASTSNWFVKNMDRIQLYTSILFIATVLFHCSILFIHSIPSLTETSQGTVVSEEAAVKSLNFSGLESRMLKHSTGTKESDSTAEKPSFLWVLLMMFGLSIGLVAIVDRIVDKAKKMQTKILREVLHNMSEGSGDLTNRVVIVQADETGLLSEQLNRVLDRLQTMFRHISDQTELVAESSRAVSSVLEGTVAATEQMAACVSQINSNTTKNQRVVQDSKEALNSMLGSLEQITENVNTQAAHVEQTSSAMTEMIANIQSVNDVTSKANEVSKALKIVSSDGGQAVLNSITAVKDIEESSNEVNSLVQIISRILAATNMLAMNAAIEAAHAGDAGRGFAVVAEEVRNLADDSSSNLRTISENIRDVIEKVNRGVDLSETAGSALKEISEKTEQTTQLMSEVAYAMQEQSAGANEVLSSISSLVEASATINRLSEEQHQNNDIMKQNLENTVNAFSQVQSATAELELGNREILSGIEDLKDVINNNGHVVDALQQELKGFKI